MAEGVEISLWGTAAAWNEDGGGSGGHWVLLPHLRTDVLIVRDLGGGVKGGKRQFFDAGSGPGCRRPVAAASQRRRGGSLDACEQRVAAARRRTSPLDSLSSPFRRRVRDEEKGRVFAPVGCFARSGRRSFGAGAVRLSRVRGLIALALNGEGRSVAGNKICRAGPHPRLYPRQP